MPEQLTETRAEHALSEATGSSVALELITPGWGSSGYYSPAVLEAAGRDRVFPAGTHMYIDHPSASEDRDRPERSVRDLAAVLTTDATWNGTALVAEARVFGPYQQLVAEMKDVIGVSIRASGDVEIGEAEGRRGRIITSLVQATSVDLVTRAGRGGRIAQLLESARPTREHLAEARNVGQWVEAAIHRSFTVLADDMFGDGRLTREERIALSSGIGDALAAFVASLEANAPQLYQRDLWDEPTAPAVTEGAFAPTTESHGLEGLVPELTEAEVTALRDQAALAEAAQARADAAEAALAESNARHAARPKVAAKVAESKALAGRARTQARVVESIVAALPVTDGRVADEALTAAVEAAVADAEAEFADIAPAVPQPLFGTLGSVTEAHRGHTHDGTTGGGTQITESDIDSAVGSAFGRKVS
ncbi:hypothetical protein [Geodermatophilus chilensis]|uniref:hypothetical protein n=1 Tax=Geodermatophilus chilensis TaxID=2035835 RepID=UPI0012FFF469|nr:hypothetical protein [Geodermatophilus chilensis]